MIAPPPPSFSSSFLLEVQAAFRGTGRESRWLTPCLVERGRVLLLHHAWAHGPNDPTAAELHDARDAARHPKFSASCAGAGIEQWQRKGPFGHIQGYSKGEIAHGQGVGTMLDAGEIALHSECQREVPRAPVQSNLEDQEQGQPFNAMRLPILFPWLFTSR